MLYAVMTPPQKEPIPLDEVKLFLRLIAGDTTEDSAILSPMLSAAREYCEAIMGTSLAVQTLQAYPSNLSTAVCLPRPPIVSVEKIEYVEEAGATRVLPLSAYLVDTVRGIVSVLDTPKISATHTSPICITYVAGGDVICASVRQAILMLIAHWYSNRESVAVGVVSAEMALSTGVLLRQNKGWWF